METENKKIGIGVIPNYKPLTKTELKNSIVFGFKEIRKMIKEAYSKGDVELLIAINSRLDSVLYASEDCKEELEN